MDSSLQALLSVEKNLCCLALLLISCGRLPTPQAELTGYEDADSFVGSLTSLYPGIHIFLAWMTSALSGK